MSAPATEGSAPGNRRLQQTQAQVDEVVDIMRVNVDKVLERDSKLSELDDRADALQAGASQFETSAAKLKRKFWWKNCKVQYSLSHSHTHAHTQPHVEMLRCVLCSPDVGHPDSCYSHHPGHHHHLEPVIVKKQLLEAEEEWANGGEERVKS
uniref:Vesicle associated membrane protein 3 n=1 Tax=Oncorhynchus mykiss TaxID=8022 RepID=A0A8C7W2B1_ONCMY